VELSLSVENIQKAILSVFVLFLCLPLKAEASYDAREIAVRHLDTAFSKVVEVRYTDETSNSTEPSYLNDQLRAGDVIHATVSSNSGNLMGPFSVIRGNTVFIRGGLDVNGLPDGPIYFRDETGEIAATRFRNGQAVESENNHKGVLVRSDVDFRVDQLSLPRDQRTELPRNRQRGSDSAIEISGEDARLLEEHYQRFPALADLPIRAMTNALSGLGTDDITLDNAMGAQAARNKARDRVVQLDPIDAPAILRNVEETFPQVGAGPNIRSTGLFAASGGLSDDTNQPSRFSAPERPAEPRGGTALQIRGERL